MNLHDAIDDLAAMIQAARAMPLSSSCIINRSDALDLVNRIRQMLPEELRHANLLLREREAVLDEARREGERIVASARARAESEFFPPADYGPNERGLPDQRRREFAGSGQGAVPGDVLREAETIRREADEYVDHQLANLEVILNKALASIQRGRDRIHGVGDGFGPPGNLR